MWIVWKYKSLLFLHNFPVLKNFELLRMLFNDAMLSSESINNIFSAIRFKISSPWPKFLQHKEIFPVVESLRWKNYFQSLEPNVKSIWEIGYQRQWFGVQKKPIKSNGKDIQRHSRYAFLRPYKISRWRILIKELLSNLN